jgi:hypothetical protein
MWQITALLLGIALFGAAARAEEFKSFEEAKNQALATAEKGLWKQIHWVQDPVLAQQYALKTKKPIMVFMLVGEHGRKNASEC